MEILSKDIVCRLGDGGHREDVAFLTVRDDIVRGGTGDGASVPHCESHPLKLYNGKSGAELMARCYKLTCEQADPRELFERTLLRANDTIRMIHQVLMDITGSEPGSKLNGVCFGAFEINSVWTRILWAGDAQVFIRFKDGNFWMTCNEMKGHDAEMYSLIASFTSHAAAELGLDPRKATREERSRIRARMYEHFYQPLCRARDQRINTDDPKGYSLMNGHPGAPTRWQKASFRTADIEAVGSVTDGLMQPRDEFAELSEEEAARRLFGHIEEFGTLKRYADALGRYEKSKPLGHVQHMEKAGVLVYLA